MFPDTMNISNPLAPTAPQSIIFGSIIGNNDGGEGVSGGPNIDIFNCTFTTPRVEANITCNGTSCKATQLRRSEKDRTSPFVPPVNFVGFANLLSFIRESLGTPHDGDASAPDQYLLGSDTPFSLGTRIYSTGGYANVSGKFFAARLTTLLNTAWQASLCPYSIALGSAANLTACQDQSLYIPMANTTARNVEVLPNAVYIAHEWRAIVLLLITTFLQLAALATMALTAVTRVPNVLGYVSSLTRDSACMARVVPPGGSTLDGAERARLLGDVRARLVDARPGEPVGRIVFAGVEDQRHGGSIGSLRSGRVYE